MATVMTKLKHMVCYPRNDDDWVATSRCEGQKLLSITFIATCSPEDTSLFLVTPRF
jgi:hypothetical protein